MVKVSDDTGDMKVFLGPVPSDGAFYDASLDRWCESPRERLDWMEKRDKYDP